MTVIKILQVVILAIIVLSIHVNGEVLTHPYNFTHSSNYDLTNRPMVEFRMGFLQNASTLQSLDLRGIAYENTGDRYEHEGTFTLVNTSTGAVVVTGSYNQTTNLKYSKWGAWTAKTIFTFNNDLNKNAAPGTAGLAMFFSDNWSYWGVTSTQPNRELSTPKALLYGVYSSNVWITGCYTFVYDDAPVSDTLTAAFVGEPLSGEAPLTVNFTDQSTGSITTWNWSFGNQVYTQQQNPSYTYFQPGDYNVSLTVTNTTSSATELKPAYIHVTGNATYHLPVDVRDVYTHQYIKNARVGLYDQKYNDWRFVQADGGYTGFIHSGGNAQYDIELGNNYTVTASNEDYQDNQVSAQFMRDYQLYTVYLTPFDNSTVQLHLDVNVKNTVDKAWVENAVVTLYDPEYGENKTQTCFTGACGFNRSGSTSQYPLVLGKTYKIFAEKEGYNGTSQEISFVYDHETWDLWITSQTIPENIINVDIRDTSGSLIEGADIGIYDYEYDDWRNYTCDSGQCFISYVGDGRPVKYRTTYRLASTKTGYYPTSMDMTLTSNGQVFTLVMKQIGVVTRPTTMPIPTTIPVPTITMNQTPAYNYTYTNLTAYPIDLGLTIPDGLNATQIGQELRERFPLAISWLVLCEDLMIYLNYIFLTMVNLVLYPILMINSFYGSTIGLNTGILLSFAQVLYVIGIAMTAAIDAMPPIVINMITFLLSVDVILLYWNLNRYIHMQGGSR